MTDIRRHTGWTVAEFTVGVCLQFFVIRYIVISLGLSALGVWSVLMSAVQLARLFDPGAAAGSGRLLSLYLARGDQKDLERTIASIFYAVVPLYALISIVLYFPLYFGLDVVLPKDQVDAGHDLLPFAILSYVLQIVAGAYSSSLVSIHAGSTKSQITIIGCALQAAASMVLIPHDGIVGLALAQVLNYLFVTIISIVFLKKLTGIRFARMTAWHGSTFRSVMRFGIGIQFGSLAWTLFEMSIRFAMSYFGGVAEVGYYEIAYRIASQFRVLALLVGQPLAAVLTALSVKCIAESLAFYRLIYARYVLYAVLMCAFLIVFSPITSIVMTGQIDAHYIVFSVLAALGTLAHIAAIPSEATAMSRGLLRFNLIGTVSALTTMIVAGSVLGSFFGAYGVAVAVLFSSLLAAAVPIVLNGLRLNLPILPRLNADLHLAEFYSTILRGWMSIFGGHAK